VMQFNAPQNAIGCIKKFPNKRSLNSARLGKNSVKWGVFIPSVVQFLDVTFYSVDTAETNTGTNVIFRKG
jgi:hypothetical protein